MVPEAFAFQVFLNIVSNSVKFSPHGGEIDLETQSNETRTRWILRDQGVGLKKESFDESHLGEVKGLKIASTFAQLQGVAIQWYDRTVLGHASPGTEVVFDQKISHAFAPRS